MEPRDESGKWLFIAHTVCCGTLLLAILLLSHAAFLLSLVRSSFFWAGLVLLLSSAGFYLIRGRRTCAVRPAPEEVHATTDERSSPALNPTGGRGHGQEKREWEQMSVSVSVRGINPPTAAA